MPVWTNPRDMKEGVHYCALCSFHSKDKNKVKAHVKKIHKKG